jgi:hypothetical protein
MFSVVGSVLLAPITRTAFVVCHFSSRDVQVIAVDTAIAIGVCLNSAKV